MKETQGIVADCIVHEEHDAKKALDARGSSSRRRILAFALVAIMMASALAVAVPALLPANDDGGLAKSSWSPGDPERKMTFENFGYFHRRNTLYNRTDWNSGGAGAGIVPTWDKLGRHYNHQTGVSTEGMNSWMFQRELSYGEYITRGSTNGGAPYFMTWDPYGGVTTADYQKMGFLTMTPTRITGEWKNITTCNTSSDLLWIPDFTPMGDPNGGNVTLQYYLDDETLRETSDAKSLVGPHFARWFYGTARGDLMLASSWDGYIIEVQGHVTMDRWAANRYLSAPTTGDLAAWFAANDEVVGSGIEDVWFQDWFDEGNGVYDIYYNYEGPYYAGGQELKLDTLNTSANTDSMTDTLSFFLFHQNWGDDGLFPRWAEMTNLTFKNAAWFNSYCEDWSINITATNTKSDATMAMDATYLVTAWEDEASDVYNGAWIVEPAHIDYCGETGYGGGMWVTPFDPYDPDAFTPDRVRYGASVGTTRFNNTVSYWLPPKNYALGEKETMTVKLNQNDFIGIAPYVGGSNTVDAAKVTELKNNMYWGRMVLGKGSYPYAAINSSYDRTTKTITMAGPMAVPPEINATTGMLKAGSPRFMLDVVLVDHFDVAINDSGAGQRFTSATHWYTATITAKNGTGATMTSSTPGVYAASTPGKWNVTVNLACNHPATFGSTSHIYIAGDNGVWSTTVAFDTVDATTYVNATDSELPCEVTGSLGPFAVQIVPEFATLLVPVIGIMAIFLVIRAKKRREEEA